MKRHSNPGRLLAVLVAGTLCLVGCGGDDDAGSPAESTGTITVSATASLTEVFTVIGDDFEAANPGTEIEFNFDSSTTLSTQIIEGAPADVYASADQQNMDDLLAADKVDGEPATFARNEMVIVTKPDDPEGIDELTDLTDAGVVSLCGEDVPCGRFATTVLEQAEVTLDEERGHAGPEREGHAHRGDRR